MTIYTFIGFGVLMIWRLFEPNQFNRFWRPSRLKWLSIMGWVYALYLYPIKTICIISLSFITLGLLTYSIMPITPHSKYNPKP